MRTSASCQKQTPDLLAFFRCPTAATADFPRIEGDVAAGSEYYSVKWSRIARDWLNSVKPR